MPVESLQKALVDAKAARVSLERQRDKLTSDVKSILDSAASDGRELTADEVSASNAALDTKESITNSQLPAAELRERIAADSLAASLANISADRDEDGRAGERSVRVVSRGHSKYFPSAEAAYSAGQFVRAAILGSPAAKTWCVDNGVIPHASMGEGTGSAGGYLVPDELHDVITNLQGDRSVFQRNVRVLPMGTDRMTFARVASGATVYYPGENTAITASDLVLGQAVLSAVKYAALTTMSTELSEDAITSMADLVAEDFAYRFADAVDKNGFLGDGSGTYGGVTGLTGGLHSNSIVQAPSGNVSFETLDLVDFEKVIASTPVYAAARNKWYISSYGYWQSMVKMLAAGGGNAITDIGRGPELVFLGAPVELTDVLPGSGASAGDIVAFYGDLRLAATMGIRRGTTIRRSDDVKFIEDEIAIRATQRVAITVHEGTTSSPVGPVVGLKLAAS